MENVQRTFFENVNPNSVEIERGMRGEIKIGVKVYDADEGKAATRALATFRKVIEELIPQIPQKP